MIRGRFARFAGSVALGVGRSWSEGHVRQVRYAKGHDCKHIFEPNLTCLDPLWTGMFMKQNYCAPLETALVEVLSEAPRIRFDLRSILLSLTVHTLIARADPDMIRPSSNIIRSWSYGENISRRTRDRRFSSSSMGLYACRMH